MKKAGIESTKPMTRDEAAEYWSKHYMGENTPGWEEVDSAEIKLAPGAGVAIEMDAHYWRLLKAKAKERGTDPVALAKMFIQKCLDNPIIPGMIELLDNELLKQQVPQPPSDRDSAKVNAGREAPKRRSTARR
ncbi:MAG: hypothetical protein FJ319_04510 [SAR202 cluster bacterium]|nr:hypothetical protein [SAR202 cluster bacterium]